MYEQVKGRFKIKSDNIIILWNVVFELLFLLAETGVAAVIVEV